MHFDYNNGMHDYYMDGVKLNTITEERDLDVLITNDLKPSVQCTEAAINGTSALRLSKRSFNNIDSNTFNVIYKTYFRSNMELCIQAWSHYMANDIEIQENVQHGATRMIPGDCQMKTEYRTKQIFLNCYRLLLKTTW